MPRYVILDRDGVINQDSDAYIKSPDEWIPIPGSLEAIAKLNHAGYRVAVATNQSGIARGLYDLETLDAIHQKMFQLLSKVGGHLDFVAFCPHRDRDQCACRKPRPGLYRQIAKRWQVTLDQVFVIGDSPRDLQAAFEVNAHPIRVFTGKGRRANFTDLPPVPGFENLQQAVEFLLHTP